MDLGAFSVSLAVKDIAVSLAFYERLGFTAIAGDGESWSILANGSTVIGLFQGMFESNILTFNPGWEGLGNEKDDFTDVRSLNQQLKDAGVAVLDDTTAESVAGPASFSIADPDGNVILFDQHV